MRSGCGDRICRQKGARVRTGIRNRQPLRLIAARSSAKSARVQGASPVPHILSEHSSTTHVSAPTDSSRKMSPFTKTVLSVSAPTTPTSSTTNASNAPSNAKPATTILPNKWSPALVADRTSTANPKISSANVSRTIPKLPTSNQNSATLHTAPKK